MKTHEGSAKLTSLVVALAAALSSGAAITDESAVEPPPTRIAVEIDLATLKIDVAAGLRAIDSSLKRAKVQQSSDGVRVAAADARTRR